MVDKSFESEKFRAQIHLLMGSTFCSPLCLNILDLLRYSRFCGEINLIASFIFFIPGYLLINNSYNIINTVEDS
jgi:hypothetical protein